MNFILAYLEGEKTDESFVAYGAGACLAFMIVPWLSVIFYLLAFLGLTAYHVKQKKVTHGFYQFLAALFSCPAWFFSALLSFRILHGVEWLFWICDPSDLV